MSFKDVTRIVLFLSLLLIVAAGGLGVVNAERSATTEQNRKRCYDYDRNAKPEEERTSGDCNGTVPTPEPVTILLFSAGLAGIGFAARRRLRPSE